MGNKNYRGRATKIPTSKKYTDAKLAAEKTREEAQRLLEQNKKLTIAYELHTKQVEDKQYVRDFDYSTLPQHWALQVKKDSGTPKLFIQIDIIHPNRTAKEVDFLHILPKYAPMIRNVEFLLIAPSFNSSVEVYSLRIKNMIKTINILNTFHLKNLHFIISVNRPNNFMQIKLAAACFGLKFDNWTMGTAVFGDKQKEMNVGVRSSIARRLAGVSQLPHFPTTPSFRPPQKPHRFE
ncbi:uncharacterized protein EAF01_002757 [Botrytis porri]|uniref:uncharacterized protein n=1 Tax=Botrytis porri TaxID=87229 RepID=UPI001902A25D|nr:uncharacterized protein EAF01_002757 [Botrytis porri]KAF7911250.1 hypothetical protein EAF01_002757 [Botrytis porri]